MKPERRYDIDWIRVMVFDILILYHVGMFFVEWDWHIKNNEIVEWVQYPMTFVNQWRIPILFVVSGMGTRFALSFRSGKEFIKERIARLFIPLLFGMLVIVPPQVYLERLTEGASYSSFLDFYPHYFEGIYPTGNFSWHHLWFLPYLLTMSLLATPLFLALRKPNNRFIQHAENILHKKPFTIFLAVVPVAIIEYSLAGKYPKTHAYVDDWYCWAMYSLLFLLGYVLICAQHGFWPALLKIKGWALLIGLMSFSLILLDRTAGQPYLSLHGFMPLVKSLNMWSWILVVFAYAASFLNKKSAVIIYRNKAVYPFYILHQTIIIICGYYLMNTPVHYAFKMLIMIIATFGISWLIYEYAILNIPFMQPLFGVKKRPRQ